MDRWEAAPGSWIRVTAGEHIGRKARITEVSGTRVVAEIRWGMSKKTRTTDVELSFDAFRLLPPRGS
jgi:hypothetical protein